MKKPEFKSRENKEYKTEDGTMWNSRSVALLGILLFVKNDKLYVLAEKRSQKMDAPGLWCVPCGYIDWDETAIRGLYREVYEETGIFIPNLRNVAKHEDVNPFYVYTEPIENRQNITLSYSAIYDLNINKKISKMVFDAENFKNDEIDQVKLIEIIHLDRYAWAFSHDSRIIQAGNHIDVELEKPVIAELAQIKKAELDEIRKMEEAKREFDSFSFLKKIQLGWVYKGYNC